jgi:hypothetical protein
MRREQFLEFRAKVLVRAAGVPEKLSAFVRTFVESGSEEFLDATPPLRSHIRASF